MNPNYDTKQKPSPALGTTWKIAFNAMYKKKLFVDDDANDASREREAKTLLFQDKKQRSALFYFCQVSEIFDESTSGGAIPKLRHRK